MKSLLVLGASGLLGSSFVKNFSNEKDYKVFTHGNSKGSNNFNGDLTSKEIVEKILNDLKPDVILNLVALTNVDECEKNSQRAYLVNSRVVENIAGWINQNPRTHLVQISTDHLYDNAGENQEENVVLRNYYAYSKYIGDLAALRVNGTVLRTNFFGKSLIEGRSSFTDWIHGAIKRGEKINLFTDVYFSPLSIATLCSMISTVILKPIPGLFNLGSREGMSKADFALKFAQQIKEHSLQYNLVNVAQHDLKARRPSYMQMDVSKFQTTFKTILPTLDQEILLVSKEYR